MNTTSDSDNVFFLQQDPRVKGWYLIDSPPLAIGTLLLFYLFFVTKIGPSMMKTRRAFQLKHLMIVYNISQMIFCSALALLSVIPLTHFTPHCAILTFSEEDIILPRLSYAFFLLKLVDLLDTIIFVLRKKDNQVTLLHVYHHVYAVLLGYMNTKYLAGNQIPLLTLLNSAVHILMYYYLTISALTKRQIWWKKYLTTVQLIQLSIMFAVMVPSILNPSCQFPKMSIITIMFLPTGFLIKEFVLFYKKTYKQQTQPSKAD